MFKDGDRYHHEAFGTYCWIVYEASGINDAHEINSFCRFLYTRLRAVLVEFT